VPDRLLVDLRDGGQAAVQVWPDGEFPQEVSRGPLVWPLDADALEDLRWYLEDYLRAPFGVWEDRGPTVQGRLARWGDQVFGSVFGSGPAHDAYQRTRDRGLEVVFRSAEPGLLGLPWELMRDGDEPVALGAGGFSRSLPVADSAETLEVPGGRLRVLMVISRPAGTRDVGYQMVARPLLERLDAVRGEVDLTVMRPPTFDALEDVLSSAAARGEPFHAFHFDGHGMMMPGGPAGGRAGIRHRVARATGADEGVLIFEKPGGGSDHVGASKVAKVLADGRVPVVVLNACQSGAVGKQLEASVATALLRAGCAAVVGMAYSVYAVAAAEFMAAFYESLFAGVSVGQAVTAGRHRLFEQDGRPSPKGDMPLADWLVPVHYMRKEVRFAQARAPRPAAAPSLDVVLDQVQATEAQPEAGADPLAAVGGVFLGRDDLFYQLEVAARLQRVVVLTGPGGTGKTELAKGFARWWRDTGGVGDPRLVLWHSFEPGVASFGLDGVITGLGLAAFGQDFTRLNTDQRLTAVKRLLTDHRALMVWDNFETVREMPDPTGAIRSVNEVDCAALKGFLEWVRDHSSSAVIITSRAPERWLGQIRRITVGGLSQPEAAQYATHLLAPYPSAQAQRERRSFGELLEWLDGHPLAMRLTLPRLNTADPASLLAALRGTTALPAKDTEPGRLSSLGASIAYSFTHLSGQTRRLLPAVSLLYGVVDTNLLTLFSDVEGAPDRFVGISQAEWTAMLSDAARVGLLTGLGSGMYQIPPALPGHLADEWHAENSVGYKQEREVCERALCTACSAYSQWLTGQIDSGNATLAYGIIGLQRRTLGAMLGYALDHHVWDDAGGIVRALNGYWDTRGLGEEAAAWADRILNAIAGQHQDRPVIDTPAGSLWLLMTIRQADRKRETGHLQKAEQTYRETLAHLENGPETDPIRANIAILYHKLGNTAWERGRLDEADDWHQRAVQIFEELGDRPNIASMYHQFGNKAQARTRLDEARDWYRKALTIFEELGDRPRTAGIYHQLGITAQVRGQLDEADKWYRRALILFAELGDRPHMAGTYHQLGMTAEARWQADKADEQLDEAGGWYRRALIIWMDLGDRPRQWTSYQQLGMIALAREQLDEGVDWFRKALTIAEELGDPARMTMNYMQLSRTATGRGQPSQALEWNIRSVALSGHRFPEPALSDLATLSRQLGMPALEETWRQITGQPMPQTVRAYITTHD
jgi:tetratricopeptide (TPR) repeat protein